MKEKACPAGGPGKGPGQPEIGKKHRKCLQKRGSHVNRFTWLPPFSAPRAAPEGPWGGRRRPFPLGRRPCETLQKRW